MQMSLIAGLLASTIVFDKYHGATGLMICAISVLGVLLNVTHHDRFKFHSAALDAFREELEKELGPELVTIGGKVRGAHKKRLRLHKLWSAVYAITFSIGAIVAFFGVSLNGGQ